MTKIFLCFLFLALGSCSFIKNLKREKAVNNQDVPAVVRKKFLKRHPDITTHFQEQIKDEIKTYEATFVLAGKKYTEIYSVEGYLVELEKEITLTDIKEEPRLLIENYLREEDPQFIIRKIQQVESKDFNGFEIEVETIKSSSSSMEYFFFTNGSFSHQNERITD
jgi:hypothetical protein